MILYFRYLQRVIIFPVLIALLSIALIDFTQGTVVHANTTDILISEVFEDSTTGSPNAYVEIYNGTGSTIDLGAGNYVLAYYAGDGNSDVDRSLALTGLMSSGTTRVFAKNTATLY